MQGTVHTSAIFAGSARQGHVEAPDGSKVWVLVYDADDDGLFNGPEDEVCVDVDGSESLSCNYDEGTELFRPGELFEYRGEILNPNSDNVAVQVSGVDDEGNVSGEVEMELAPGAAREVYANELEAAFGDGEGKWRLNVSSSAGTPEIWVMNLMETPEGHLSNLSRTAAARTCAAVLPWCRIPLFRSTSNPDQQGFIRVVNLENSEGYDGQVDITAKDDARAARGPVSFVVQEGHAVHFNSDDLELGNRDKGLAGQLGRGTGDWYLLLFNDGNAVIKWLSLVRTRSGFVTNMNETVQRIDGRYHVSTFNPGSNASQRSWLRLVDTTGVGANVTIRGRDDSGEPAPEGEIQLSLDPTGVMTITAQEIEVGGSHFSGRFGDGFGKWQLFIEERSDEAPSAGRAGSSPDPEVVAKPKRRQFSAEYRLRILEEAERCTQRGEVGRLP